MENFKLEFCTSQSWKWILEFKPLFIIIRGTKSHRNTQYRYLQHINKMCMLVPIYLWDMEKNNKKEKNFYKQINKFIFMICYTNSSTRTN